MIVDLDQPAGTAANLTPDVCVVGGGAVGFTLATALARAGADVLLQALQGFSLPFQLRVAGACQDSELTHALEGAIAAHPGKAHIRWDNRYIDDAEIVVLFGWADATVLPYRHIDQSSILYQSLRYGVPLVASRVGSFERYVTAEVGEIFDSGNVNDLRRALLRVHARRAELSRSGVQSAARRYEWPQTAKVLLPMYALRDAGPR